MTLRICTVYNNRGGFFPEKSEWGFIITLSFLFFYSFFLVHINMIRKKSNEVNYTKSTLPL